MLTCALSVLVRDFEEFNDFMLDVVRGVDGVRETRTVHSFGGRADLDSLLDLEMEVGPSQGMVAGNVLVDVKPGMDRECSRRFLICRHTRMCAACGCSIAITAMTPT